MQTAWLCCSGCVQNDHRYRLLFPLFVCYCCHFIREVIYHLFPRVTKEIKVGRESSAALSDNQTIGETDLLPVWPQSAGCEDAPVCKIRSDGTIKESRCIRHARDVQYAANLLMLESSGVQHRRMQVSNILTLLQCFLNKFLVDWGEGSTVSWRNDWCWDDNTTAHSRTSSQNKKKNCLVSVFRFPEAANTSTTDEQSGSNAIYHMERDKTSHSTRPFMAQSYQS